MKKFYSLKRVVQLSTAFVFTLILIFVYSCRKELKIVPLSAADSVDAARSWYEKSFPVNNALGVANNLTTLGVNSNSKSGDFDFSQYIKPDWKHNARYTRFNKAVLEMPVDPSHLLSFGLRSNKTGLQTSAKENSRAWFILLNDGKKYDAYIMVLIGDPDYINGDASRMAKNSYRKRDANFSGMLLYFTPKGTFIGGYKYKNGKQVKPGSTAAGTQTQSTGKKTNQEQYVDCEDWVDVIYDVATGEIVWVSEVYQICTERASQGGDNGGAPPPPPPPPPPCVVTNSVTHVTINKVDPGDGGGDDGGGDTTPPDQDPPAQDPPTQDPTNPGQGYPDPTPVQTCPPDLKDPCAQVLDINAQSSDPRVAADYTKILNQTNQSGGNEYAINLATANWGGGPYIQTDSYTDGYPDKVAPQFTWNSIQGFTTGIVHTHPEGTGPYINDIFELDKVLHTNTDLRNAPAEQQQYYKDNASVTAVSTAGSMLATVRDFDALMALDAANPPDADGRRPALDAQYEAEYVAYQNNHAGATVAEISAYALYSVLGNYVNIYYTTPNSTTYTPMAVDATGKMAPKNCN